MPQYQAPVDDIKFILHDWLKVTELYLALGQEEAADKDLINAVIDEAAKFAEQQLSPLNHPGDQAGCVFDQGRVTTPAGFRQAYQAYCDAGWASLRFSTEYGGQGLPPSLATTVAEMTAAANTSWSMYPGLTHGVISALSTHGSPALKDRYLANLIHGRWTGTMCLTEAHCGSDLGLLKTKAEAKEDDSYAITGSKIFISAGEHDISENIIHLVLARLPGAPAGTKGISLFVVPKLLEPTGQSVSDNNVDCGSIEHKMGIKASATCVINFEKSTGYMVGEPNKGLSYMFTMMNSARLATGIQGYAIADLSRSASLNYAKERLQMRSLSGPKYPEKPADPIIVHPDVKRMLLTQKSLVEGCRGLAFYVATLIDQVKYKADKDGSIDARLGLLTPICKAFMSEAGFECSNHAVQVLGGHGYICEWELEQQVRDARISMIYEGTNGIQALDLLGRKILKDNAKTLASWVKEIAEHAKSLNQHAQLSVAASQIEALCEEWMQLTAKIGQAAQSDMDEVGAAAFDFLMYSGYVSVAHVLLKMAQAAITSQQPDQFKACKLQTLEFYTARILPRTLTHSAAILSGNSNLQCSEFELD
jgi:alkylation response protein AidB-like acyl-CoA dehydrogenase